MLLLQMVMGVEQALQDSEHTPKLQEFKEQHYQT